jgi:ribosomal protein S18 acetylase RimI-like enzyme
MFVVAADRWLGDIMRRPVQRVAGSIMADEAREGARLLQAVAGVPGFAYGRVSTADVRAAQAFEEVGFRIVDTSVTLEAADLHASAPSAGKTRLARGDDAPAVEAIARTAFRFSRFHLDPRIPKELADEIKAQWAGNFFRGERGEHMVVAEHGGEIAGFLQLLSGADGTRTIDLIAVAPDRRGQGLASAMIGFAARECGPLTRLRVGTQAANLESLRLYARLGFGVTDTQYVFHCHGPMA